jgi:omega-6 fatty acid desaturase (delta-12 desaturase)
MIRTKIRSQREAPARALRSATLLPGVCRLMSDLEIVAPLPPDAPLPARRILRDWLTPMTQRDTARAVRLVLMDFVWFGLTLGGTLLIRNDWLKVALGLACGFVIGRLFILGHDACHQSFAPSSRLNRWLGRLVFLPSLTPYSLWEIGHNVVHHGYTNLTDFDFVWQPPSLAEYRAMPLWRRGLERCYRSGWAPGLYYLIEVWWKRMYFPNASLMKTRRPIFIRDCLLITAAALLWSGGIAALAFATAQSFWLLWLCAFLIPLLFWNMMIGFVVYVHHTHPAIDWYDDKAAWAAAQPFVSTTVHLTFAPVLGVDLSAVLHHITEHTAHHVDMRVPLYHLAAAQKVLETRLPGRIVIQRFSWRWYFDTARRCKLYDIQQRCWTDFSGRPTHAE